VGNYTGVGVELGTDREFDQVATLLAINQEYLVALPERPRH
jgi:hypothetical protein